MFRRQTLRREPGGDGDVLYDPQRTQAPFASPEGDGGGNIGSRTITAFAAAYRMNRLAHRAQVILLKNLVIDTLSGRAPLRIS
jgi:hypothetical protein